MTDVEPTADKPRWCKLASGDWRYERGPEDDIEVLGVVVFQDLDGQRTWYSVSQLAKHGPEAGALSACKRRIERLWK